MMRDLVAQVTGSLLRFPEVTVDALGENEVALDTELHGKFTLGRSGLAWLACGPQLEVVHGVTGERFSAYRFSGVSEHPPSVLAVRSFTWLKRNGLLVGLEEDEGSMLCLYDLGLSRVVKAVVIPGRITGIEPLVSYGGASTSTQHLHQSLRWFFGAAAVVTDIGHVLLVDLCLDDLSCTQSELEALDLEVVSKFPSDIPRLREGVIQQGRHLCLQLSSPTGTEATALHYIQRTNQLAVGFSDGYLQLWNMKTLKKEYHSQLEGGRVPVYAFTFQEPENDPRNCCYLWAVQSTQDHVGDMVSLRLLQLAFGERKCLTSGKILYEGLEYCEERYSQDLNGTSFPLRAQATNTRLLSCQTIEKFRPHPDRDDSMNEVASPDTSVSVFSWQVKSYGQGQLSTFIGVFDINRWYHAQMPDSLRAGESLQNCPYLAVWSLDSVAEVSGSCPLLDVLVHERSLSRPLPYQSPPPEQFFSPTTYNFDASCLLNAGIVHVTCSGYQKETLCYLKKAAPSLSDGISNGYSRCLMAGLLSSRLADVQPSNLSQEEQLDAILTTAVETSSLGLITGCIKQWTAEEHPGSAANLRYILEWAWNKVVQTKEELDSICAPLYDSSSNFTDPQTLQLLQHSQRLLGNLSTIFHCMLNEAKELTHRGLIGLMNKSMVSSLISQYAQVVLWFCRTGLLPESFDEDVVQISRPFYSFSAIKNYYTAQREELQRLAKDKWCCDCLMIDGLVSQCGDRLCELWKRDEAGTGQYPPPSLHALLDLYLLENVEESAKHAIVIYLLLDVMYSFPNKSGASVESFPTAFAIPIGLVKLVQGLWLLDHHDHESSVELLLHPATSRSLWSWQHDRVLQVLMCQGKHSLALRYLHVVKPPISCTAHAKLRLSVLLHNRCLVEAWALLRQHANKVNLEELQKFLYETCQELDLMKDLLKLPLGPLEQACLERFLQNTGGFQNRELLMVHYLQQANYVPALQINQTLKMNFDDRDPRIKERSNTRNSILNQYGKVLPRAQRKLAIERAKPYQHAATILREVTRPQPLSAVVKPSATNNVLTKAAFIKNVLTKIQEVWVGKDPTPQPSPLSSPRGLEVPAPVPSPTTATLNIAEAFVGTPINMLNKRMSRLLDLVVQPSFQTSPEAHRIQATPTKPISSWTAPKSGTKAPELSLLQTPQVVKRARVIAAAAPVFSFTPQSILRTSLRPTPVATPSASPGRSATPPLRPKESRITFIEETSSPDLNRNSVHWSNGLAAKDEAEQPQHPPLPPEGGVEAWSEEEEMEREQSYEEMNTTGKAGLKSDSPVKLLRRPSLGHETSQLSVQSDTTLEFHDVPSPGDLVREKLQRETASARRSEVTVRLPDLSSPAAAEETPVQEDQDTSMEDTSMEEAQEPSAEAQTPPQSNTDDEEDDSEEQCEGVAQEFVPKPQTEGNSSESLVPKVVNHCPKVVTDSKAVCEEAEVSKKTPDPIALPVLMHEESVTEEISISRVPAPQQAISEVPLVAVVPITDSTAERMPEYSEPVSHEPFAETAPTPEELVDEFAVTEPVSKETQAEDTRRDESEADELNHKTESDLDDFVERQLFGGDLSHSGNVEATGAWSSFHSDDVTEPAPEDVPVSHTPTSATSSESATSESHSVVSLNDTDELSSAESEEESGAEEEEDSGSEVEIIEEVKGSSVQLQQHPTPALYLEELPSHQDYLREQATAVLSLVSPEQELKVIDGVMDEGEVEGEVVMVGLEPAELVEGDGAVCYTELKPSTTLLVPLELAAEHQDVLGAAAFQTRSDDDQPAGHNTFSLMLEAEDGEGEGEGAIASGLDPNNHLIYNQDMEVVEDLQSQTAANDTQVVCLENAGQDAQECLESFVPEKADSDAAGEPDLREEHEDPAEMIEDVSTGENGNHVHLHDGHESDKVKDSASTEPAEHESQEPEVTPADHISPSKEIEMDTTSDVASEAEKHLSDAKKVNESTPSLGKEDAVTVSEDAVTKISPNREETTEKEKVVQRSPGRKSKRIVTLPLSIAESEKDQEEEQNHNDSKVPSTLRRVTRSSLQPQDVLVPVTPRRSTRKTEPESQVTEEAPLTKATKPSSPARRAPLKTTPRRGRPRTRNADTGSEEEVQEACDDDAKPWVRQSARKSSIVAEPVPEESVSEPPTRATRSPGRTTRQSSRGLSLGLDSFRRDASEDVVAPNPSAVTPPRSRRKTGVITAEKAGVTVTVDEAQLQSVSRRLTRSRLWRHDEEKEHVLETTVDVEPTNPLASSLMGRLNEEEDKAGSKETDVVTQIVRAKRRATRSAAVGPSQDTAAEETPKLTTTSRRTRASKASEPASSSEKESSTLPRTRGRKKDSAVRNEVVPELLSPPVTRARRAAPDTEDIMVDTGDILVIVEEVKPRKKRSTRARAAAEPPPPVEVNLVSPLGSPAQTDALGQGEMDERNATAPKISLRRKRMMEAIFPKPLTRRKRL